ncbi:hypothetical protein [Paludisphaera soli]|uniref:hypothetical protein n=1 Tax=Paludisphaera soli TaxID=2712865 RepID=UPI0013ED8D86|nr:hypothetical protein [Paludisphaera soli]
MIRTREVGLAGPGFVATNRPACRSTPSISSIRRATEPWAWDRGTLPETLGDVGFLFTPPEGCTSDGHAAPTAREVAPWMATIERLRDDAAWEARHRELALKEAGLWASNAVAGRYLEFFGSIARPA